MLQRINSYKVGKLKLEEMMANNFSAAKALIITLILFVTHIYACYILLKSICEESISVVCSDVQKS